MKTKYQSFMYGLLLAGLLQSCKKADSATEFGTPEIFIPQASVTSNQLSANYAVPSQQRLAGSSEQNYRVDTAKRNILIVLGVSRSSLQDAADYSVDIISRPDTINQLISNGQLAGYTLLPATAYTLPGKVSVAGGNNATFYLSVNIDTLYRYVEKKLAIAVALRNPSRYQLNQKLSTVIVLVDVKSLLLGSPSDITATYLKNSGNPFSHAAWNGSRYGNLQDWTYNTAIQNQGGYGGWDDYAGGKALGFQDWGYGSIVNGKIYQTASLAAGTYYFSAKVQNVDGAPQGIYLAAAAGTTMPDAQPFVASSMLGSLRFTTNSMNGQTVGFYFTLGSRTTVSLGLSIYLSGNVGLRLTQVYLYNFPNQIR